MTDSDNTVVFDPENKPGIANLMSIMSAITGQSMDSISDEYSGKGYGIFKDAVADCVIAELAPLQERFNQISADKAYLSQVMTTGAERAGRLAARTMSKVRRKIGLAATEL